jgi:putative FmdB family regulatory protein
MPTYTYECDTCGCVYEHRRSILEHEPTVACGCGSEARQVFNWQGETVVKGNMPAYKLDHTCMPIGWERGNTGEQQEQRYSRMVNDTRKRARAVDKQAIKGGIRHIAKVPREIVRMRSNQFGKDYLDPSEQSTSEIKAKLRADGMLFKD